MKAPTASAILSVVALSSYAFAAVTIPIAKSPEAKPKVKRGRNLLPRAAITESLLNNATGGDYIAQVTVGTPGQPQTLLLDTGSSDVWMLASTADLCTDPAVQSYYQTGPCSSTCKSSDKHPRAL
jgi:predicted aspartyl protease